jgi:probable phosphoglycerate mutase
MREKDGLFILYADGACRGNPGPMGVGAAVYDSQGKPVREICRSQPWGTNNQAEYLAAVAALEAARELGARRVELRMDSEQFKDEYRVKDAGLQPLCERARELLRAFDEWRGVYVRHEGNSDADRLANRALDLAERSSDGGGTEEAAAT